MLIYEIFETIKFQCDYTKLLNIVNSTEKLVIKNKPSIKNEIEYDKFGEYKELVKEFVRIFKNNFSDDQINNLLSNLETLSIKKEIPNKLFNFSTFNSLAYYNSLENEIVMETDDYKYIKNTLYHELLHVASRREKGNDYYCGFDIRNIIGIGLNEDYTEYLLEKYFKEEANYEKRANFLRIIENIIGEERLEELYFNADLPTFINELSKYTDKKEAIRLLYEYDALYNITYSNGLYTKVENKIEGLSKQKEKVKEYVI